MTKQAINLLTITICLFISIGLHAQNIDFTKTSTLGNLYIRMYGDVQLTQQVNSNTYTPGKFDASRIVALFGYQFDRNTQFVTEWELEHANEIYLEQAFVKHKLGGNLSIKAGMILIPMGIINEYHEPNNYYSVDRPYLDKNLVPTTWRDLGAGITGLFPSYDLKYQLYLVNGFLGYKNGQALFNQESNFRSGRQKGVKTIFSTLPSLSGQLEYYGLKNGKVGVSLYAGESNSDAFAGISRNNEASRIAADSTSLVSSMVGFHASTKVKSLNIKSQLIYTYNHDVQAYNKKGNTDLAAHVMGFYTELGIPLTKDEKFLAFTRYSVIDKLLEAEGGIHHILTSGLNYFPTNGAVFKLEGQIFDIQKDAKYFINCGVGVWF